MEMADDPFTATPVPKPKKPLFKRQAKSAPKPPPAPVVLDAISPIAEKNDEDLSLFQQSKHFFSAILRDQDEEREAERRISTERSASETHNSKRQKLSQSEGSDGDLYDASPRSPSSSHHRPITPPSSKRDRTRAGSRTADASAKLDKGKGLAGPYSLATPTKGATASSQAVDLDDSDDDDAQIRKRPLSASRGGTDGTPTIKLDDSDEDDTKAAIGKAAIDLDDDIEEVAPATEPEEDQFAHFVLQAEQRRAAQKKAAAAKQATAAAGGPVPLEDRVVTIMVTSRLGGPDMKPLSFKRRVSGNIKAVRDCVEAHAPSRGRPLTPEERETLFVTWKGRRLYNLATIMSLGVVPDEDGYLRRSAVPDPAARRYPHEEESDGYTETGALHFEVWTEEGYEAWSRQQKKRRARELGEPVSDDDDDGNAAANGEAGSGAASGDQPAKGNKLRLTMKSKDHEPVKTSVSPDDTIADMILAFRTKNGIAADKHIEIHWDGDRLDEDAAIADTEIEDRDTLEVYVR